MQIEHSSLIEKISGLLPQVLHGTGRENLKVIKLHGDASNRIYYRVEVQSKPAFIVMQRPMVGKESASEEISKQKTPFTEYPFISIHRYLKTHAMPVPEILAVSDNEEFILLEDLGETTFEKATLQDPQNRNRLYEMALVLLQRWQTLPNDNCIAFERDFDPDLFDWEFEHFLEWGIEKSQKRVIPAPERQELTKVFHALSLEIIQIPKTLTHRDYQSRNLMVKDKTLFILDFQDALQGPYIYDVVALLRDSYIELPEQDLLHLIQFYAKISGRDEKKVLDDFFLQTIQRKLKDGGRFHYIHLFKGNPGFLPYVSASFRYAHHALTKRPEGKFVIPILAKYLPEFRS